MIIDSFDDKSPAKINPEKRESKIKCDVCIVTFSNIIEEYVVNNYGATQVSTFKTVTGTFPVYLIDYKGKVFGFYKTFVGAPSSAGILENVNEILDTKKFIVFGGSGCLNKSIAHGKVMIPTESYRDDGLSYHYKAPADYIKNPNADKVAEFMAANEIPYILGRNWTTDAFFRETEDNIAKRQADGCISVEMECAGLQAVCDFRGKELYYFLTSGDLLDAPVWDKRRIEGEYAGTQHDITHFDIAIELANYVCD